jgi:hypothetical protein
MSDKKIFAIMGWMMTAETPPIWCRPFNSFEEAWEFIYENDPLPEDAAEQNNYYDDYYVTEMSQSEYERRTVFSR